MAADILSKIENTIMGGIVAITLTVVIGNYATYNCGKRKGLAEGFEKGKIQGREEATSNLVSALNIATSNSLTSLHFRARGIINDDSLAGYQKIAIAGAYMQGISHLEDIQNIFNFNGNKLATGKIKAEELQKKIIQIYGGTTPANYDYSKWKQEL